MNSNLQKIFAFLAFLTISTHSASLSETKVANRRRQVLSDEKILLYRLNDESSVYIVNKLNNKFTLNNPNEQRIQSIENSFNSQNVDDTSDSMFTVLYSDDRSMLVGAKNRLLNVSLENFFDKAFLNRKINWSDNQKVKCNNKEDLSSSFYNPFECDNYIRGSIPLLETELIITCGTNSNQPYCRKYFLNNKSSQYEFNGYTVNNKDNHIYMPQLIQLPKLGSANTQNVPPFNYLNSIYFFHSYSRSQDIYKQNYKTDKQETNSNVDFTDLIKTPLGSIKNPNFRTSYGYKDKVYFFFSESELSDFNNGVSFKTPHSLVGEICANDDGRSSFSDPIRKFLTFKKAIINCYVPDYEEKFHVKYTEIQEATKPVKIGHGADEVLYAIFTIRRSANVFDSALCMYKMTTIEETLKSPFKNNPLKTAPIKPLDTCDSYKSMTTIQVDNYFKDINKHGKFQIEQTINEKALFALNDVKFTSISVDSNTNSGDHILFVGLNDGRILKVINKLSLSGLNQPIIIGEYQVFPNNMPINKILIYDPSPSLASEVPKKLIAVSNREIKSIGVEFQCAKYKNCQQCVNAQDPYCSWSILSGKCLYTTRINNQSSNDFIQDILNGDIQKCKAAQKIDSDIYYSISDAQFSKASLEIEDEENLKKISKNMTPSASFIFLIVFFTAFFASVFSVILTCFILRKRFKMPKSDFDTFKSSSTSSSDSTTSATSWRTGKRQFLFNCNRFYSYTIKKFNLQKNTELPNKCDTREVYQAKQKIRNCYEPNGICKNGLKPVTVLCSNSTTGSNSRPNSTSEDSSPTTTSSITVSSNNNSPNNLGASISRSSCEENDAHLLTPISKYTNIIINGALSSSDESFEQQQQQPVVVRSQNTSRNSANNSNSIKRYQKITNNMKSTSDNSNVTTNLLRNGELDI